MLRSVDLHVIAGQAQAWLTNQSLAPQEWTQLPAFPEATDVPVWLVPDDPMLAKVQPDSELRARTYRRRYDPEGTSNWVFVPGTPERVWLVNTKKFPVGSN